MKAVVVSLMCVAVAACNQDPPMPANSTASLNVNMAQPQATRQPEPTVVENAATAAPTGIKATMQIADGMPEQTVYLSPVGSTDKNPQFAELMRQSGFACATVSAIYLLRQEDGQPLDVFKVDCDTGSYQLTEMNGKVFIKDWSGKLMGS